jgi:hypothetical protein
MRKSNRGRKPEGGIKVTVVVRPETLVQLDLDAKSLGRSRGKVIDWWCDVMGDDFLGEVGQTGGWS